MKKKEKIIDKCLICGLRCSYRSSDKEIDERILQSRTLYDKGIVKLKYLRDINMSCGIQTGEDRTYYCAVANHKTWKKPYKKCIDWQFRGDDSFLLSDYLAIYHTRRSTRMAVWIGVIALIITIILGLLTLLL